MFLIAALDPFGEAGGVEALGRFAQFIEDDMVREAIVEHEIEHVSGWFGKAGLLVCVGLPINNRRYSRLAICATSVARTNSEYQFWLARLLISAATNCAIPGLASILR